MQSTSRRSATSDWVSIGRAAELLGVNPATLREWASLGKLHAYRTPGGHRRFSATELAAIADPSDHAPAEPIASDIMTQLRHRYHGTARAAAAQEPWISALTEPMRLEFRALGEALLAAISKYAAATSSRERRLARTDARNIGVRYGQLCQEAGLDTAHAVETYLRFRRPLLDVLGRAIATHPDQGGAVSRVLRDAETLMDDVLTRVASSSGGSRDLPMGKRSA